MQIRGVDNADKHFYTRDLGILDGAGKIIPTPPRSATEYPAVKQGLSGCPYIGDARAWFPEAEKEDGNHA